MAIWIFNGLGINGYYRYRSVVVHKKTTLVLENVQILLGFEFEIFLRMFSIFEMDTESFLSNFRCPFYFSYKIN